MTLNHIQLIALIKEGLRPHDNNGRALRTKTADEYLLECYYNELDILNLDAGEDVPDRLIYHRQDTRFDATFRELQWWYNDPNPTKQQKIDKYKAEVKTLEDRGTKLPTDWKSFEWYKATIVSEEKVDSLLSALYMVDVLSREYREAVGKYSQGNKVAKDSEQYNNMPFSDVCLDKGKAIYSEMLIVAIECWKAIYINGYKGIGKRKDGKQLTTSKHHAEAWLNKYHSKLTSNAKKSILLVAISDKD